jgi:hypothetical protein
MKKGEAHRKRIKALEKRIKSATGANRIVMIKKRKALADMADNEDWLAGKPGSQLK